MLEKKYLNNRIDNYIGISLRNMRDISNIININIHNVHVILINYILKILKHKSAYNRKLRSQTNCNVYIITNEGKM